MARPKPIAVAYDPEIDDPLRFNRALAAASSPGTSTTTRMPDAYLTRAVGMIALALWLGGQAATVIMYYSALSLAATYSAYARAARLQLRASYALLPSVAGELALMSLVAGVVLLLTTLREGYYAERSPWSAYLPCAGCVIGLALLLTANHVQFSAYSNGYGNVAALFNTLLRLSDLQVALLCSIAFGVEWLQSSVNVQKSDSL